LNGNSDFEGARIARGLLSNGLALRKHYKLMVVTMYSSFGREQGNGSWIFGSNNILDLAFAEGGSCEGTSSL